MQEYGPPSRTRLIDIVDIVALGILHIDLDGGEGAGLVHGIHEVELELEDEIEEPLIPHLD